MKTRKHFLMAATLVLLAGLSGVMAQGKLDATAQGIGLPIMPSVSVNAIEVSDGIVGLDSRTKEETAFGYSFLGRTTGSFPGSFTLSMNCTPATPIAGEPTQMTGGSWTLPVYTSEAKGGYAGSLYGTVVKGTMNWDKTATNATVYFVLNVDGGTQSWGGVSGYAIFSGTLLVDEKTAETTLTGDLVFSIIGAK
jgi:hypothetical protein